MPALIPVANFRSVVAFEQQKLNHRALILDTKTRFSAHFF